MPKFTNMDLENYNLPNNFGFSGTRPTQLGASEYTLVTIAVDVSASVSNFATGIEKSVKEVVLACRNSPRSDNLLLRVICFGREVVEYHGFIPLSECDTDKYNGVCNTSGPNSSRTALFDASWSSIESLKKYAADLDQNQFSSNGILFVITDGEDNASKMTPTSVKDAISAAMRSETLESLVSVLIGVNVNSLISSYLESFKDQVGFTQYVGLDDASANTLAKLAAFVSKSISSQSQALGSGGASKQLTF